MKKDNQFTALVYHLCPICAKKDDGEVLIHTRLGDLSKVDGQNIGFGNPCAECQAGIDAGAIMIIVVDASKSDDMAFENLYRTGEVFGVRQEAIIDAIDNPELRLDILKKRCMIMDYLTARQCGLPTQYLQPTEN